MGSDFEPDDEERAPLPFAPPLSDAQGLKVGPQGASLAPYFRRVSGYLIDFVLLFALSSILLLISRSLGMRDAGAAFSLVASLIYPWLMIAKADGQTVGMKALSIRCVEEATGGPVSMGRALGRSAAAAGFSIVGPFLVFIPSVLDLLWPAWDKRRQTLHDKIAATVVINVPRPDRDTITFG